MTPSESFNILIIDDMVELRKVLGHFIKTCLHAEIVEAVDGLEAIEHILHRQPDLVFCDLNMPSMTGFEFLGFIRRQQQTITCPIIVLTSEHDEETRIQAIELSVDDYLQKPFDADAVLRTLRAYVPQEYFLPSFLAK